jgi:hypothetical protein
MEQPESSLPYSQAPATKTRYLPYKHSPPPPGATSGGVVYLRIVLSPEESSRMWILHNFFFHGEELLAPRPTTKLEDHPSSAVRDC